MVKGLKWTRSSNEPSGERMLTNGPLFSAGRQHDAATKSRDDHQAALLRTFEESQRGWFWSVDAHGCLTYISEDIARLVGNGSDDLRGRAFSEFFTAADDDQTGRGTLAFVLAKQSAFSGIGVRPSLGDQARYWAVSGTPQFDQAAVFCGFQGSALEVTQQRLSSEHASQLAKYDALTGLPNRRRMAEMLDAQLAGAAHHHRPCAILIVDLDRFKQINDTLGHPTGDALLKQVADRLVHIVGDKERVFRLGGDEFQIVLPRCEDREIIGQLAAEIVAVLAQPYSVDGSRCVSGASVGIAVAPADGRLSGELMRNADLALYSSKNSGRGRFRFFSADLLEAERDKRSLEEDLRDALARGEMSMEYQPFVDARTNEITGVEALIRWTHPTRGAVSPALFVPIAEEAGIVAQLGNWALRQACADAVRWPGNLRVAVNVSPVQFNGSLTTMVTSALASSGLPPERLELEITEGVFLSDSCAADAMFDALKQIGVRLALDDFGTGYSSLGYLRTAPFDKIKIDQTFIRDATLPTSRNGAIIAAIVALAEALDMETTAEGIEYLDQLELIRSLRVSHVQGWIYSKAMSSDDLTARLADGNWTISPSGPATQRSDRRAMYRKIGVVYDTRYRSAIVRNLSKTGALIEGLPQLPTRTLLVVDFGDGQFVYARVVRSAGRALGILFEQHLIDDGNGGLCTSHRASPYTMAALGLPTPGDPDRDLAVGGTSMALDSLASRLGLKLASRPQAAPPTMNLRWAPAAAGTGMPTVAEMSKRYLDSLFGDETASEIAKRDLQTYVLPIVGTLPLDQMAGSHLLKWLDAPHAITGVPGNATPADAQRLKKMLDRVWSLAADLKFVDATSNPLKGGMRFDRRGGGEAILSAEQAVDLLVAARASANRQLKYIVSLLMITGARTGEILNMTWDHIDLPAALWQVHVPGAESARELSLSKTAVSFLDSLPRLPDCCYVVPNPATNRPYRSLNQSWDVVKARATLPHLELDDLRYCDLGEAIWQDKLLPLISKDHPSR